jgi:hypothetical protein
VSAPVDELDAFPRPRRPLPFERHRREPKDIPQPPETSTVPFDPLKWKLVRTGLGLVFWGWAAILGAAGFFAVYWFWTFFFAKPELPEDQALPVGGQFWQYTTLLFTNGVAWIRTLGMAAGCIALLGAVAVFAGQCLCVTVPAVARARGPAIGAVVASVVAIPAMVALPFFVEVQPLNAPNNQEPAPGATQPDDAKKTEAPPAEIPPKVEAPPTDNPGKVETAPADDAAKADAGKADAGKADAGKADAGKVDAPPAEAAPKPPPPFPAVTVPSLPRLLIFAAYFLSQVLFLAFLKQVALYFHNVFLADATSAYLALLFVHTALLALLPPAALVACFFWVIMLALEFLLIGWLMTLVAGTRKAIG